MVVRKARLDETVRFTDGDKAMDATDIVLLKKSDFAIAGDCLADAFEQDPFMSHLLPDTSAPKRLALKKMSQGMLNFAQPYDHIYTTADQPTGVAVWQPPGSSDKTWEEFWNLLNSGLLQIPLYLRWSRLIDAVWLMSTLSGLHKKLMPEPHWYLMMLGVSPDFQGEGIGGKLIQPVLDLADRDNIPCYLETTTPGGVRFYKRRGFEVIHQDFFAGHSYWNMRRSPQN